MDTFPATGQDAQLLLDTATQAQQPAMLQRQWQEPEGGGIRRAGVRTTYQSKAGGDQRAPFGKDLNPSCFQKIQGHLHDPSSAHVHEHTHTHPSAQPCLIPY